MSLVTNNTTPLQTTINFLQQQDAIVGANTTPPFIQNTCPFMNLPHEVLLVATIWSDEPLLLTRTCKLFRTRVLFDEQLIDFFGSKIAKPFCKTVQEILASSKTLHPPLLILRHEQIKLAHALMINTTNTLGMQTLQIRFERLYKVAPAAFFAYAARAGHPEMALNILLNTPTKELTTATLENSLIAASSNGHAQIVSDLLGSSRASEIATFKSYAAFQLSVCNDHPQVVAHLLNFTATWNIPLDGHHLSIAAGRGFREIVLLLLNSSQLQNISIRDALKTAVYHEKIEVVLDLLNSAQCKKTFPELQHFLSPSIAFPLGSMLKIIRTASLAGNQNIAEFIWQASSEHFKAIAKTFFSHIADLHKTEGTVLKEHSSYGEGYGEEVFLGRLRDSEGAYSVSGEQLTQALYRTAFDEAERAVPTRASSLGNLLRRFLFFKHAECFLSELGRYMREVCRDKMDTSDPDFGKKALSNPAIDPQLKLEAIRRFRDTWEKEF